MVVNRGRFQIDPLPEPEITECLPLTGGLDYVLRVQFGDVEVLRQFTLDKLETISCVAEAATMRILEASESVAIPP